MAYSQYRSPFGDTTYTKVFVGGLAWETPTEKMRKYFEQFGEILEAVIISNKSSGKSKGYGFVTYREPESARRACADPNPVIDGRRANCNIASFGRAKPSPPRGRNAAPSSSYHGGSVQSGPSYGTGTQAPFPPPPFIYSPYSYQTYSPGYGYQQATLYTTQIHQPQYLTQTYGSSSPSSSTMISSYYYGYTLQTPSGTISTPQGNSLIGSSSYIYHPTATAVEASSHSTPHTQSTTSTHPFLSSSTAAFRLETG